MHALLDVQFVARPRSVHALLGENGAGKTTLMRIAYGLLRPDRGHVRLFGQDFRELSVRAATRAGLGMVHQHLSLVGTLTAAENVALGRAGAFRPREATQELARLTDDSGLHVPADAFARDLSIVEQQRLEILKALARGARVLILDEPTTGLAPAEIDELLRWIRRFADSGGTVILVTHRLREALAVADEVTVLRRGQVVFAAGGAGAGTTSDDLARAIFPDTQQSAIAPVATPRGSAVAALDGVTVRDRRGVERVRSASLHLHSGELVGLAGVEGSGHRELLALLGGLLPPAHGRVQLPDRLAVIPADRLRDALVPEFSLVENVALHAAGRRRGRMPWPALARQTTELIERYGITAPGVHAHARDLSGGNQQRLVVARELHHDVDLVVADEPTRGLDIRAAEFVRDSLRTAATRGAAVLVYSSDIDEVLTLATRVLVIYHGVVREVAGTRDAVGRAMLGAE